LSCLAIDSKEMAVTWPVLIVVYEGVFRWRPKKAPSPFAPVAITAIIAVLYGLVKTRVPNEMSITQDYVPRLSLPYAARQFSHYYSARAAAFY
jgi:hypothetical protein